ncbi:hypothetical protein GCK32_008956, partial [Trichostrongylus colubriformis]
ANADTQPMTESSMHFSTIIIILLSIMLIAAVIVAVFRRVPVRFDNPLYVAPSVSYSDRESGIGSDIFS